MGLAPALISGDSDQLRAAMLGWFLVLLRVSGPLQSMFRSLNKLRGGLPEVKDALDLLCMRQRSRSPSVVPSPGCDAATSDRTAGRRVFYGLSGDPVCAWPWIPVGSGLRWWVRPAAAKPTGFCFLAWPESGELLLDGLPVSDEEMPTWQANCAFVPQQIRLLDAVFARTWPSTPTR